MLSWFAATFYQIVFSFLNILVELFPLEQYCERLLFRPLCNFSPVMVVALMGKLPT